MAKEGSVIVKVKDLARFVAIKYELESSRLDGGVETLQVIAECKFQEAEIHMRLKLFHHDTVPPFG